LTIRTSTSRRMSSSASSVSLPGVSSGVPELTVATFVRGESTVSSSGASCTSNTIAGALVPAARPVPLGVRVKVTSCSPLRGSTAPAEADQPAAEAVVSATKVTPAGNVSTTVSGPTASLGPRLRATSS